MGAHLFGKSSCFTVCHPKYAFKVRYCLLRDIIGILFLEIATSKLQVTSTITSSNFISILQNHAILHCKQESLFVQKGPLPSIVQPINQRLQLYEDKATHRNVAYVAHPIFSFRVINHSIKSM